MHVCLCCLALLFLGLVQGHRQLHVIVKPDKQESLPDSSLPDSPDIPLDEPPLVRKVKGYEPEGVHVSPWQLMDAGWTMLVSWQSGEARVGSTSSPPPPHDPTLVKGAVKYGRSPGHLSESVVEEKALVYSYKYGPEAGGTTYQSPVMHHALLKGLPPGATIYYSVGSEEHGFSEELELQVPGSMDKLPVRIGLLGDLGQTLNSTVTLAHLQANDPDVILHVGDFTYADNHCSDGSGGYCPFSSDQRRWDSWARMTQPVYSRVPVLHVHGNHETEVQTSNEYRTYEGEWRRRVFGPYNARYPLPVDPSTINTSPNFAATYLDVAGGRMGRFVNEGTVQPNNSYYSIDLPGFRLISLSSYVPYGRGSAQFQWFVRDIASVDRSLTPWLVVQLHASPRNNYVAHFKEVEEFMEIFEPIFYQHQVDLVFGGHTHAFERSQPMYNYTRDNCGPIYTCIGDGGNIEGLARTFIDGDPPAFCSDPDNFELPGYQPRPSGQSARTFQDGRFCPTSQPQWSAHRDPSFGHGILTILNATLAQFQWFRNQDGEAKPADQVWIERPGSECSPLKPRRVSPVVE